MSFYRNSFHNRGLHLIDKKKWKNGIEPKIGEKDKTFELEIKIGDDFHLGKVRVKIISDIEISEVTSKSQIIKRLSARFINLNALQEYELRRILKKYGKEFSMG